MLMNETSKSKEYFGILEQKVFKGNGIDIGCGDYPIFPNVKCFDIEDGDANKISHYIKEQFDFVFSSHCLEHMRNPSKAIKEWWKLVRNNGYLYVIVPDEDLYEQHVFPSKFNCGHNYTFTISKKRSWSFRSVNIIELIYSLQNVKLLKLELQDNGYVHNMEKETDQTLGNAVAQICFCLQKDTSCDTINYASFNKKIYFKINEIFINFNSLIKNAINTIKVIFKKL